MANNIAVTEGSGKTVATEDIGGIQYQKILAAGSVMTVSYQLAGSILAVSGSSSVQVVGTLPVSSVSGVGLFNVNHTGNGSVITVSTRSSVTVLQGTNPWVVGNSSVSQVGSWNLSSVIGALTLYDQPANYVSGVTSMITGTTAVSVMSAPGASLRNFITQITVTNAATAATVVQIKDSGANVLHTGYAAASGGGYTATFPAPIRQATQNASIDVVALTQASVLVSASGYKAA